MNASPSGVPGHSAGRADGPEVLHAAQQVEIEAVHDVADAGERCDGAEPLAEGRQKS